MGDPDRRFQEDGLRVMRSAAAFGYEIETRTTRAVHENRVMLDRGAAERINAEPARRMLRALKFDNETRKRVVTLVEHHDAPLSAKERTVRRWLNRLGAGAERAAGAGA